jgi:hypothetical protein
MPPPNQVAETLTYHQQIRAPAEVEEPLESIRGEASRRAMGQMGMIMMLAHAPEGKMPIGEALGRPPDPRRLLPFGCQTPMIRMPVVDEDAHARPEPCPNLGIFASNPDACLRVST